MTKSKRYYGDDDAVEQQQDVQPTTGVVQPGCSEPDTVPPSVVGTTHDPKRKPTVEEN